MRLAPGRHRRRTRHDGRALAAR